MASSTALEISFGGVGGRVGRQSNAEDDEDNIAFPERLNQMHKQPSYEHFERGRWSEVQDRRTEVRR